MGNIVDSLDEDIQRMSWLAIESFENNNSKLEKVVKAAKFSEWYQLNQRRKHVLLALFGLFVFVGLTRVVMMGDDQEESPAQSGSIEAARSDLFHELQHSYVSSIP